MTETWENSDIFTPQPQDEFMDTITWYKGIQRIIKLYYIPVILVLGMVGNILILMVVRTHLPLNSCKIYINALVSVYMVILVMIGVAYLSPRPHSPSPRAQSPSPGDLSPKDLQSNRLSCKISFAGVACLKTFSGYIVCCISADRYIAVAFPFWWRTRVTYKHAYYFLIGAAASAVAISVYMFQVLDVHYELLANGICSLEDDINQGYLWVEMLISALIPFIAIFWLNVGTIRQMIRASKLKVGRVTRGRRRGDAPEVLPSTSSGLSSVDASLGLNSSQTEDQGNRTIGNNKLMPFSEVPGPNSSSIKHKNIKRPQSKLSVHPVQGDLVNSVPSISGTSGPELATIPEVSDSFTTQTGSSRNSRAQATSMRQTTVTLICLSFLFLISSFPGRCFTLWLNYTSGLDRVQRLELQFFCNVVLVIVASLNCSVNIWMFTVSSRNFSKHLKQLICRKKNRVSPQQQPRQQENQGRRT